jgi:DNA-binding MarR family transcriptional regulator
MARSGRTGSIQQFLGSAHLFSSALTEILQNRLLWEAGATNLSFSQLKLLQLLAITETQTIGELAAFLGVSNAAASKTVEKLVQSGWVSRTTAESDRRTAHVALTRRAHHLLAVYERKRQQKLAKVFDKASLEELRRMATLMDQITVEMVNHSAKPEDICLHCGIYFRDKCLVRDLGGHSCLYRRRAKITSERGARRNENCAMKLTLK